MAFIFKIHRTKKNRINPKERPHPWAVWNDEKGIWTVKIERIEQLLRLAVSNDSFNPGEIILDVEKVGGDTDLDGTIEIYDDYRE